MVFGLNSLAMSYLKFLNLLQAVKELPSFPVMDAVEERILNNCAVFWTDRKQLTVLDAMNLFEHTSPATVHRRLKTLRKKGLIALEMDEVDNRVKYIVPTALAQRYFAKVEDCFAKAQQ